MQKERQTEIINYQIS